MENQNRVLAVETEQDVASITLRSLPGGHNADASIFEAFSDAGISVDTILKNIPIDGSWDLTVTVDKRDYDSALQGAQAVLETFGDGSIDSNKALAKVSIVGSGMQNEPGYAARMFQALADAGINIHLITTSEIQITCIIAEHQMNQAVRSLHDVFAINT